MRLSHIVPLFALWAVVPVLSQDAPLLTPQALEDLVNRDNLLNHAAQFLAFSELSNFTRAFGSKGHNATIWYIKDLLDATGYYDTEFEEFVYSYSEATAQFSANGQSYPTKGLGYAPSGEVTGPVVVVNDLGCTAVMTPSLDSRLMPSHYTPYRPTSLPLSKATSHLSYEEHATLGSKSRWQEELALSGLSFTTTSTLSLSLGPLAHQVVLKVHTSQARTSPG